MRRLTSIAAFGLLLLAVPLWAQHGGGGHGSGGGHGGGGGHSGGGSFGGHAGFSGGHSSGGGSPVHSFSGPRSAPGPALSRGYTSTARGGFSHGPFLHNGFGGRGRNFGFRNRCYGYACRGFGGYGYGYGYPWGYGGYYDPYWWGSDYDDDSYDQDYYQNLAVANDMNEQSLEQQQMMRQEEADGDQDAYARPPLRRDDPGDVSQPIVPSPIMPATVLIFRDQHKQEVQNYAIVGQTLWNFAPQHTQKIPLTDLDIPATVKANDDNGVTFRVPNVNEGQ